MGIELGKLVISKNADWMGFIADLWELGLGRWITSVINIGFGRWVSAWSFPLWTCLRFHVKFRLWMCWGSDRWSRIGIRTGDLGIEKTGWWFGTVLIFPYIGNVIIPTDELIFFRGVAQPPTSSWYGATPQKDTETLHDIWKWWRKRPGNAVFSIRLGVTIVISYSLAA